MLPPKRRPPLTVALPSSTVSEATHLRDKTLRLGFLGRLLAVFRVDQASIYLDKPNMRGEGRLVEAILSYMATPQYLRRELFKLTPELKYVGVLPPLRTPNHPLEKYASQLEVGSFRQGMVIGRERRGSLVNVGVEIPALISGKKPLGSLVNVKIVGVGDRVLEAVEVGEEEIPYYWGFKVKNENKPLDQLVKQGNFDLAIATSKYGEPLEKVEDEIFEAWRKARSVLVAFGSPTEGLKEILARRGLKLEELFHFTVNTVRFQGVETVRVEEALAATLSLFNYLIPG
ncbi:MAG: hypothetical protein DRO46_04605 [Candidatus Hecatellales archaeon]|nr:MAG: hypothetical protein DRO46_04605 [Candidatus Hecatellales archaeon]